MHKTLLHQGLKIIFKRNVGGKSIRLRVRGEEVILTAPLRASLSKALELVDKHIDWIRARLLNYKKRVYEDGSVISILGREYTIHYSGKLREETHISDNILIVGGRPEMLEIRIKRFLSSYLETTIHTLADEFCLTIEANYKDITVRKMVTKWGSCTSKHSLSFSTRLVFAPYWILEYVVAHEVCHIKEFNHSAKFWNLVESIYPNWRAARIWLKEHGISLG